ncbi:MAG TPA: citrate lyase acyl carrier protein [Negativicutes bacterium]|nr:citrate lyase acyl carrier protein [Negativicutes bacterium]
MAKLLKPAQAGTLESGDIMVTIVPAGAGAGVSIDLESIVLLQYGPAIQRTVEEVFKTAGIEDATIRLVDRGALDCTIRARLKAAIFRAGASEGGEHNA